MMNNTQNTLQNKNTKTKIARNYGDHRVKWWCSKMWEGEGGP